MATEAAARTLETWQLESLLLSRISESTTNPRKSFALKAEQNKPTSKATAKTKKKAKNG